MTSATSLKKGQGPRTFEEGKVFSVGSALSRRLDERPSKDPSTLNISVMMLTGQWRGSMLEVAYGRQIYVPLRSPRCVIQM